MSEMREIAYLLQHVTSKSIVLIDELGRGTSPEDALGIGGAVCEDLARTRAFCFFATHLHELTCTLDIYPNIVNLQFKVNVTVWQAFAVVFLVVLISLIYRKQMRETVQWIISTRLKTED